jgi:predicted membrane protein
MLLIAIGFLNLFGRNSWITGFILMAVGAFFILPEFDTFGFSYDYRSAFWPVLLILLGVLIIVKKGFRKPFTRFMKNIPENNPKSGFVNEANLFSGNKYVFPAVEFKGGKISNVFGGSEIDLTQTTLAEGSNILEVECIFGGISLIVPTDWTVHLNVKSAMGGFVDKRRVIKTNPESKGELVIKGSAVFGGGEIKSY